MMSPPKLDCVCRRVTNKTLSRKLLSIIDIGENTICHFVSVICFCSRKYFNRYWLFNSDWNIHSVCITHWVHSARGERNVRSFPKCLPLAICPSFIFFPTLSRPLQQRRFSLFYTFHTGWISISFFFVCVLKWLFIF